MIWFSSLILHGVTPTETQTFTAAKVLQRKKYTALKKNVRNVFRPLIESNQLAGGKKLFRGAPPPIPVVNLGFGKGRKIREIAFRRRSGRIDWWETNWVLNCALKVTGWWRTIRHRSVGWSQPMQIRRGPGECEWKMCRMVFCNVYYSLVGYILSIMEGVIYCPYRQHHHAMAMFCFEIKMILWLPKVRFKQFGHEIFRVHRSIKYFAFSIQTSQGLRLALRAKAQHCQSGDGEVDSRSGLGIFWVWNILDSLDGIICPLYKIHTHHFITEEM